MAEVSPEEHAARLRLVRMCMGMLCHPEGHFVFARNPRAKDALRTTVAIIARYTPLTDQDLLDYAEYGSRDIRVRQTSPGVYKFSYIDDETTTTTTKPQGDSNE